jgi:hypothetical protein
METNVRVVTRKEMRRIIIVRRIVNQSRFSF